MKTPTRPCDALVDGAYIDKDLGIAERSRRRYLAWGFLPPPDANMLGKNLWRVSTYHQFKRDLFAGKFAKLRRPPSLRAMVPAATITVVSPAAPTPLSRSPWAHPRSARARLPGAIQ
jgi:hypothetical protein